jgi:hypothetical protein
MKPQAKKARRPPSLTFSLFSFLVLGLARFSESLRSLFFFNAAGTRSVTDNSHLKRATINQQASVSFECGKNNNGLRRAAERFETVSRQSETCAC